MPTFTAHSPATVFLEARSMYRSGTRPSKLRRREVESSRAGGGECQWHLWPQPRGGPHHRPCRLEKRGTNVAPVLDALQAASPNRFRGIRHQCHVESRPHGGQPGKRGHPRQRDLPGRREGLSQRGFSLEFMISFPQMPEVADFARAMQMWPIILNHIGALNRVGLYANREDECAPAWQAGIAAVAACPNITSNWAAWACPHGV